MTSDSNTTSALVIAHPGHELRVYGWLRTARPLVFVLTDGSGHSGASRLASTTNILSGTGAKASSIYGRYTDKQFYDLLVCRMHGELLDLVDELADEFARNRITTVAGDAIEGYNPTHDCCRLLANCAVRIASQSTGRDIENLEFPLAGPPDASDFAHGSEVLRVELDEQTHAAKLAAAREYRGLGNEVDGALAKFGSDSFRVECLRLFNGAADLDSSLMEPPFYESYGEKQVAAGYYRQVIRYDEHIRPLAETLRSYRTSV